MGGSLTYSAQSDIDCLRAIKDSLEDQNGYLTTWNFNNKSEGFICSFIGIDCWHPDENRVLNIKLGDMELKGEFPLGVAGCSSLTGLDLSNNKIYGNIPSNISMLLVYVTFLDLSSNQLSGEIPVDLANCTYLNILELDNNQLSGQIPAQIGLLSRMTKFNVANNRLTGQVPQFSNATVPPDNYVNNAGLCGKPLPPCGVSSKKTNIAVIVGATFAASAVGIGIWIGMFFYLRKASRKKKEGRRSFGQQMGNKWAKISEIKLSDLMKVTNDFSKGNIIGLGRTGTMYKAVLEDGTCLIVKRLQGIRYSNSEFSSQMATLANVKHNNLVPLLGFCTTKEERLLVYRHMSNGSLHDKLHLKDGNEPMDWLLRLKIAIGTAKGLACVLTDPKERPTMFDVYQFLRAIGRRYNFPTEDDIFLPPDHGDADQLVELIVSQDPWRSMKGSMY
ncbi:unnamed protein product [Fraxinus pennsylvanica]|uniref:Protein kinase domain-containing protein n=1 Tax=Fraxinus pennsylvanica TaxID=56036 RepID=A0AAD1ZZT2_9LAMI|nr:unnamed protein product [Fraxinus pennsylvanica]